MEPPSQREPDPEPSKERQNWLLTAWNWLVDNRLEAYQLAQEMQADNQRLWQWNRALVDHIYKGLGPPPPSPPEDLFKHDN